MEPTRRNENRTIRRESIIDAAENLFLEKGFDAASMDDVSRAAGFTKRTIYRYFASKEDLFFSVTVRGARRIAVGFEEALKNGRNALEKIRLTNLAYYRFYIDNPGMFRLMNYQPENRRNCEASPSCRELAAMKDGTIGHYMRIIEEGKADGSINAALDARKAVYFGFCSTIGLLNTVSAMDGYFFWQKEGLDLGEFLLFGLELLADALKNPSPD